MNGPGIDMQESLQRGQGIGQEMVWWSATQMARLIHQREVSARELMEAHLERIRKVNPLLNALVQQEDPAALMAQADAADRAVAQGDGVGPLHGVPITIKDAFKVEGFVCCCGCPGLSQNKATENATIVKRLKAAGAIVLGMTNVPELLVNVESDNLLYGRTNNPYDLTRTAGGSSGGEAAIIAAGGSPLGIGTDAAGSIRIPAHYCGIAGLKPTRGRVPMTGAVLGDAAGIFGQLSAPGPMARCVDDLALALSLIAGPDGCDPHVPPVPLLDYREVDLSQLRVAYYTYDGVSRVTPETAEAILAAVQKLGNQVKSVQEQQATILEKTYELVAETIFLGGDGGDSYLQWLEYMKVVSPSPPLAQFLEIAKGCRLTVTQLRTRLREMDAFRIEMLRSFAPYDLILCPVVATPAKPHGRGLEEIKDVTYTMAHNLTGWPSAVIRMGTSPEGLPIGVQCIAKPWREDIALAAAKALEQ